MRRNDEDPELFIREMGWKYRTSGTQFEMDCPLCGKKNKFYISQTKPLFDCKVCGVSGNLFQLRAKLGLEDIKPISDAGVSRREEPKFKPPISDERIKAGKEALAKCKAAMEYLTKKRGFTEKVIKGMSLILEDWSGARWIGFPWRNKGKWRGVKFRILDEDRRFKVVDGEKREALPRFRREAGYKSILYNRDVLDLTKEDGSKRWTKIILASGETDLLSLYSMGYRGVVATTTGETSMPDDCLEELKALPDGVWILYDNDRVGFEAAKKLAKRIGREKARIVRLPKGIKDANDFMKAKGSSAKKEMDALIKNAFRPNVPTIYQIVDAVDKIQEHFQPEGRTIEKFTPWDNVNRNLGGINGLIILSAPQGTGKTTFGLNVATHWAKQRGSPALFYCLEMNMAELASKVVMSEYRVDLDAVKENRGNVLGDFQVVYENVPLYVGYSAKVRQPREIVELLRQAAIRYELQIIFFDNIHVVGRGNDRVQILGQFSLALKELSMELEIPIVAVAQPRKLDTGKIMSPWDVAYSGDVFSDADQMIFLHRQQLAAEKDSDAFSDDPPETNYSPFTIVRIAKARFGGPRDTLIVLEGRYHVFRDPVENEEIEYRGKRGGRRTTSAYPWQSQGTNREPGGGDDEETAEGSDLPF
jgi:5S rRNA maturation endonuclease (ribonuclease M5)